MPSSPGNFAVGYFPEIHSLRKRLDVYWICIIGFGKEFLWNLTNLLSVLMRKPAFKPDAGNTPLFLRDKANV